MSSVIDAILNMTMDVYRQYDQQDPDTGVIKREWQYYKTIKCSAKGIISNSSSTRTNSIQAFGSKYENQEIIQVRTLDKLTFREKISNICNSSGKPIWVELNYPSETPTVFEVIGTTPLTDPFGNVVAYNSVIKRSESQKIGD